MVWLGQARSTSPARALAARLSCVVFVTGDAGAAAGEQVAIRLGGDW